MTSGVSRFEAGDPPFYKIQTMYVPEPCPTVPLSMPKTLKYLAATAPYVEGPISSNEVPPTFITIRPPPLSIPTAIPVGTFSPNWSTFLLVFAQKSARQLQHRACCEDGSRYRVAFKDMLLYDHVVEFFNDMQWDGYREKGLMVTTEVRAQVQLHEVPRAWMRFYYDYVQRQLRETARQRTKASG